MKYVVTYLQTISKERTLVNIIKVCGIKQVHTYIIEFRKIARTSVSICKHRNSGREKPIEHYTNMIRDLS